jgi:hypothetical protein
MVLPWKAGKLLYSYYDRQDRIVYAVGNSLSARSIAILKGRTDQGRAYLECSKGSRGVVCFRNDLYFLSEVRGMLTVARRYSLMDPQNPNGKGLPANDSLFAQDSRIAIEDRGKGDVRVFTRSGSISFDWSGRALTPFVPWSSFSDAKR